MPDVEDSVQRTREQQDAEGQREAQVVSVVVAAASSRLKSFHHSTLRFRVLLAERKHFHRT